MDSEEIIDFKNKPSAKIYTVRTIWLSAMIAGPLAAAYMISENFKTFGEFGNSRRTLYITIFVFISLFLILTFVPSSLNIPIQVVPIVYMVTLQMLFELFQKKKIENHLKENGGQHGFLRIFVIGVLSLPISIVLILGIFVLPDIIDKFNFLSSQP